MSMETMSEQAKKYVCPMSMSNPEGPLECFGAECAKFIYRPEREFFMTFGSTPLVFPESWECGLR